MAPRKCIIHYDDIEPLCAYLEYTKGVDNDDALFKAVGDILWDIDDHGITPGLKKLAEPLKRIMGEFDEIHTRGHVVIISKGV